MASGKPIDRSKVPERFREPYDRTMDRCLLADKRGTAEWTVFYDPEVRQFLGQALQQSCRMPWTELGGLPDAEYRIICFNPDALSLEDHPLRVLTVKPGRQPCQWSHRDVLGAVLGAGVKRDRVGDIILHPWGAQIVCLKEAAAILEWQLDSISRDAAAVTVDDLTALQPVETQETLVTAFISAQRLDALIAAVWNLSRSEAQELVRGEKVKVNYRTVASPGAQVAEGDLVSVRGSGRFVLKEIQGTTRKDRLRVLISKTTG